MNHLHETIMPNQRIKTNMNAFENRFCMLIGPFLIKTMKRFEPLEGQNGVMNIGIMSGDPSYQIKNKNIKALTDIFDRDSEKFSAVQVGSWQFAEAGEEDLGFAVPVNMFISTWNFR